MKNIFTTKWQITTLAALFILFILSLLLNFTQFKISSILSGLFFITFGIIYNINVNSEGAKYYNKGDVMKTSPLTVLTITVGLFLLFKSIT